MNGENDEIYRIRRELEDKVQFSIKEAVIKESSTLQWRYGSIIGGFIMASAILGVSSISDIPQKIDNALRNEASTQAIVEIEKRKLEIDAVYNSAKELLDDLESSQEKLTLPVANYLLTNEDFMSLAKGLNGERGPIGPKGEKGDFGPVGMNGDDGIYAQIPQSSEVGSLSITRNGRSRTITFNPLLPDQVELVTFLSESSFNNDLILPTSNGLQYTHTLTSVDYAFEVKVIVYLKPTSLSPLIPYYYSEIVNL